MSHHHDGDDDDTKAHKYEDEKQEDEYEYESDYYSDYSGDDERFIVDVENEEDRPPEVERIRVFYPGHCFDEDLGMTRSNREATKIFPNPKDLIKNKSASPNLSCLRLDNTVTSTAEWFQNGKPTVLCFYVPWSGPCQLAAVEMEKQYDLYGGQLNFVLINVDYNGTVTETAIEVSKKFGKAHGISKINHIVMDETSKYRLGLYGVTFFPHFTVVSTARTRNQILINYDDFEWEIVRRLSACTKETVASRSANELFITREDILTLSKYLKFGLREIDIDSYLSSKSKSSLVGMSLREFLVCPFKKRKRG